MAIYINQGHVPDGGGLPFKHLDGHCPLLTDRAEAGYAVKRVRNVDRAAKDGEGIRRRCPVCFADGSALTDAAVPRWLAEAKSAQSQNPEAFWTYDLMWPAKRASQVGMATHLHDRLASRWRGTCAGRLSGTDSIPWLYDAIREGRADEVELVVTPYASRAEALAAEQELRAEKRARGWHVSSDQ
jgi:hypothetical protein